MDASNVPVFSDSEKGQPHQRRKKVALLRKAIWIHTWVLLSFALSNQQIKTATAVAVGTRSEETSSWSSESQIEHVQDVEVNEGGGWKGEEGQEQLDDVIVVATVDGTLAGLARNTGKTLWKQVGVICDDADKDPRSNEEHMRPLSSKEKNKRSSRSRLLSPLVSTKTTTKSDDYKTSAVPSVDGRVYLTGGRGSTGLPQAEAESTYVSDLVSKAPFVDGRGSFYVGSRQTSAAAIDRDTGEILRVVSGENASFNDGDLAERNIVWLGRVDNSVSMYDTRTGASDVQFSTAQIMSVQDMLSGTGHERERRKWDESLEHAPPSHLDSSDDLFHKPPQKHNQVVATPNGNVAFRNPITGDIEWVAEETFDAPIAFAVQSSTGESMGVDILPDTPVPSSSAEYVSRELNRQMQALSNDSKDEQPLVAALSTGQLFALPLGGRKGANPYLSMGLPHSSQAVAKQATRQIARQSSGIHTITGKHSQDVSSHYSGEQKLKAFKKVCSPPNPAFPGCLLGSVNKQGGAANVYYQQHHPKLTHPLELESGLKEDGSVMIHYHPEIRYVANEAYLLNRNKKSRSFFRIMGSWLPPTMALLFVLSFEFGRRHRERKKANTLSSDQSSSFDGEEESAAAGKKDGGRNVGVIQMTDEILGYGGHGTMVYRGTLDGRQVAVKRMLKTYHASADREISLLIESDGHPNVVRYFLKEVRGDFVYLALELCDLSLHDLIGSMNVRGSAEPTAARVTSAIKSTMLQIASGVRHLHSLRIVHRDLKPANILLALKGSKTKYKNEDGEVQGVMAKFDRGEYVAKISDMGLGKQLAGQSSFGFSTLGTGSLANMPSDGSTMVGAGPGSVGWQAPEVMAVRWHAEASSVRSDSSAGQDSFAESSPAEVAMSSRTSRSVDIFSLGCIFYSTLIPGSHPFGEWYEREANIMRNKPRTDALEHISVDSHDLISRMIHRDPKERPTAEQVCCHPFFWTPQQRLNFLCDVSDRLECGDGGLSSTEGSCLALVGNPLVIERNATQVVGMAWDTDLDPDLVSNFARFRTYDPSSVRDCLRLIRNKHHHYDELSADLKERIGSNPEGLQQYFENRFPRLLMHCYAILCEQITRDDPLAAKYHISDLSKQTNGRENRTGKISEVGTSEDVAKSSTSIALPSPFSNCDKEQSEHSTSMLDEYVHIESPEGDEYSNDIPVSLSPANDDGGDTCRVGEQPPTIEDVTESTNVACPLTQPSLIEEPPALRAANDSSKSPLSEQELSGLCGVESPQEPSSLVQEQTVQIDADSQLSQTQILTTPGSPLSCDDGIIVWEGSTAATSLGCRGWFRSDDEWIRKTDLSLRKRNSAIVRCADDPKFRTRLCNHWDVSQGTFCPMRRKSKCVFAHGPVELRVKEGKRNRWGKLVDKNGDNANPRHSGGEDTYGAARSIETVRKEEGKWNTSKGNKSKQSAGKKRGKNG